MFSKTKLALHFFIQNYWFQILNHIDHKVTVESHSCYCMVTHLFISFYAIVI